MSISNKKGGARPLLPGKVWAEGRKAFEEGRYSKSVELFDLALSLAGSRIPDPAFVPAEAFRWRGRALFAQGLYEQAIEDFQQVIRLQPHLAASFYDCAKALLWGQRIAEAVEVLTEGIRRIEPRQASSLYIFRGRISQATGNMLGAIDDFSLAAYHDRRSAEAWYRRALARASIREFQAAFHDCKEAIRLAPGDPNTHYTYARVLFRRGRYKQVIKNLAKVIELRPHSGPPVALLGRALVKLEQHATAIPFLEKAIERGCRDVATLSARSRARRLLGGGAPLPGREQQGRLGIQQALPWEQARQAGELNSGALDQEEEFLLRQAVQSLQKGD